MERVIEFKKAILSCKNMSKLRCSLCESTALYFSVELPLMGHCKLHRTTEIIRIFERCRWCSDAACFSSARYTEDDGITKYCKEHRTPTMGLLPKMKCRTDGCSNKSSYKIPNTRGTTHCYVHKTPTMIYIAKSCEVGICNKQASYGYGRRTHCTTHKADDMEYFKHTGHCCKEDGCSAFRHYGKDGKATHCAAHKKADMIPIGSSVCLADGCITTAVYGIEGIPGKYCSDHRTAEMTNITSPKCEVDECNEYARCSFPKGGTTRCKIHILEGMRSHTPKRIMCEKCNAKNANFGNVKDVPLRCSNCAQGTTMTDVMKKRCEKCDSGAYFGTPGLRPTRCAKHRLTGFIPNPRTRCKHEKKCTNMAMFGDSKPKRCHAHREETDINFTERPCKNCNLSYILNKDDLCEFCVPLDGQIVKSKRLEKQNRIQVLLDKHSFDYTTCDKILDKGECVKYRPDFIFFRGGRVVILEVDENQHSSYAQNCENARMINISQALFSQVIFIRYNPDNYRVAGLMQKTGINHRNDELLSNLRYYLSDDYISEESPSGASVKYLYYDNFRGCDEPLQFVTIETTGILS